jgi:hypothetical protein
MDRRLKRIIWTTHLAERLKKRDIDATEVEYAIASAKVELPGHNPGTKRIICDMAPGRQLSVVFKERKDSRILISAWWVGEDDER